MALDVGDRRIGVAVSDELGLTASALTVIERGDGEKDLARIEQTVKEHEVQELVVGLPRQLDGRLGPQAEKVQGFMERLRTSLPIPVVEWDERLSTKFAERVLLMGDVSRSKRKKKIDMLAAAIILQGYLDYRGGDREDHEERG